LIFLKQELIRKYARLIARVGANIEEGESVVIHSDVEIHEFTVLLTEECYLAGAENVRVEWGSDKLVKLHYEHRTLEGLKKIPPWQTAKMRERAEKLPTRIHVISEAPDSMVGLDMAKYEKVRAHTYKKFKKYLDAAEGMEKWCVAAYPSVAWAKAVFPEDNGETAYEKLLHAILSSVMVDEDTDPVEAWLAHDELLHGRCEKLNAQKFDYLEYKSANGTDARVWLIPETHFCGGGEYTKRGKYFNPNIPTEEIFISPMAGKAEGKFVSTMPLSYNGHIIDGFAFTFENGEVTEFSAEKGADVLAQMLASDDGARRLGEVAFVPQKNPIAAQGILFLETLFDENASCHIALGSGYMDTVEGYENLTTEECRALGINESRIHVDFMIGADDLSITGYKDGVATPIMENGEFCERFQ
jgi:aminopeptidase